MYRLLIVDDEPVIVNGLVQLFQDNSEFELDIRKAYSSSEALEIAKKTKLDILVSDIRILSEEWSPARGRNRLLLAIMPSDFPYRIQ